MTIAQIARVAYLVGHHHTLRGIDGIDYQILIEPDYIANASENGCSRESIEIFLAKVMRTDSGRRLAQAALCGGRTRRPLGFMNTWAFPSGSAPSATRRAGEYPLLYMRK